MPVLLAFSLCISVLAQTSEDAAAYDRSAWKQKYVRPDSIPFPAGNQYSKARELLGQTLFFDPRLSGSKLISCGSCHNPGFAWGDGLPKAVGNGMKELGRRTPTILNLAWAELLFWDGRAESLEEQALGPIQSTAEMNLPLEHLVRAVSAPGYRMMFEQAYPGEKITPETIARALATYERTVVSAAAPFDKWVAGDKAAISASAKRGFDLFNTKAACHTCHSGWNFTDDGFHDIGVTGKDKGRGELLPLEAMQFAFKTPTLRNTNQRAPYMHNGTEATLESVIDLYDLGGREKRPSLAPEVFPLHLTDQDKSDLIAFLNTLTSDDKRIMIPMFPR
ncbi:MAG: cytochrome c peroxidase [Acidobacteriota bacterium]